MGVAWERRCVAEGGGGGGTERTWRQRCVHGEGAAVLHSEHKLGAGLQGAKVHLRLLLRPLLRLGGSRRRQRAAAATRCHCCAGLLGAAAWPVDGVGCRASA